MLMIYGVEAEKAGIENGSNVLVVKSEIVVVTLNSTDRLVLKNQILIMEMSHALAGPAVLIS